MADSVEAMRQDVGEKAPDELIRCQGHGLVAGTALGAIVLPSEADTVAVEFDQPAVGNGDAVGVAAEIGEHGFGSGEGSLGINHPFDLAGWRQVFMEGGLVTEMSELAEEVEPSGFVCGVQSLQKQPAEQSRQHPHGQEEAGPAVDPVVAIQRDAATRHDAMHMRMMRQGRAPGMQDGGDGDVGTKVPRIGGDGDQRLGGSPEQDGVDRCLVLVGNRVDLHR